mmetsp:Transcript_18724/g.32852  ORF Transcript_18724/g.32852 Transcript_18724/m.32852 type:complete len:248 (-) Transcript_18724:120-863(-)
MRKLLGGLPARVGACNARLLSSQLFWGRVRNIAALDEDHHVGVEECLSIELTKLSLRPQILCGVAYLQTFDGLIMNEMFQSCCQHCQLMHAQASALQPFLKERLHEVRNPVLQHIGSRNAAVAPGATSRLQALDVHGVTLHEETMHHITGRGMIQIAVHVLGHGQENWFQGLLNSLQAILCDTVAAAKCCHHFFQHCSLQFFLTHAANFVHDISAATECISFSCAEQSRDSRHKHKRHRERHFQSSR